MSLLQLSRISAFYGASQALFDMNLSLEEGQVLALMGRNGMGKSTTVKVICRLLRARDGEARFAGQDIGGLPPHRVAQLGIGLVPEGRRCFATLTVAENLLAAARPGAWDFAAVAALFPRLAERRDQTAASLSGGEQQMLAIGRALMTNPRLLILDEATEGLAPVVRQEIWAAIARLKAETGLAILLIDKSIRELGGVADAAVIVEKGRSVWQGDFADLDAQTTERYLGV
ncbi:MAG: ABC transporter ATP-binding protein [Marinovum algicola]|jgi:branched-chain amino acid transport system ATP-binding protein|uniref:Amino acid/amide ABC transporter ATP-binding protein 2, HAAT family n=1 Tax=Marinovum algicola TaxID=42444 RepID=A0A975WCY8_9RHOB|nr:MULTISPECIES: ABC transporter ATP-binding protein [Marinovum]MDD9745120.1 ABC transporter ATP-binding protein [Marinovum sp. PR37]SEJ96104.1 amino acid/amide ABC transporter ATP-binding protein 2, HAAT family [Marinovum algicola]SLN69046.1 High-affinity branched-chain amino acid transport ATP-binding protein LivF [Marinovum algicola]